ncbi:MAG: hypothetical protein DWQ09_14100 [Proteobacteria bacterium]|nr:MAG: hypothetical protein DWQ09_14100 [Pseudomonadota bacterium]QKK10395.1 MAG: hypothetical protein HND59_00975 [Pseudomonadota bacterium]
MNRLPSTTFDAWQAYNAMATTKQRHLDYLQRLGARYSKYGEPTDEESSLLARLLEEHDAQVKAFLGAMNALRARDAQAHHELVSYITTLNELLTPEESPNNPQAH